MRSFADYRRVELKRSLYNVPVREGVANYLDILKYDLMEAVKLPALLVEGPSPVNAFYDKARREDYKVNVELFEELFGAVKLHFYETLLVEADHAMAADPLTSLRDELVTKVKELVAELKVYVSTALKTARSTDPADVGGEADPVAGAPSGAPAAGTGGSASRGLGGSPSPTGKGGSPAGGSGGPAIGGVPHGGSGGHSPAGAPHAGSSSAADVDDDGSVYSHPGYGHGSRRSGGRSGGRRGYFDYETNPHEPMAPGTAPDGGSWRGVKADTRDDGYQPASYGRATPQDGFLRGLGRVAYMPIDWLRKKWRSVRRAWHGDPTRKMSVEHAESLQTLFLENAQDILAKIDEFEAKIIEYIEFRVAQIAKEMGKPAPAPKAPDASAVKDAAAAAAAATGNTSAVDAGLAGGAGGGKPGAAAPNDQDAVVNDTLPAEVRPGSDVAAARGVDADVINPEKVTKTELEAGKGDKQAAADLEDHHANLTAACKAIGIEHSYRGGNYKGKGIQRKKLIMNGQPMTEGDPSGFYQQIWSKLYEKFCGTPDDSIFYNRGNKLNQKLKAFPRNAVTQAVIAKAEGGFEKWPQDIVPFSLDGVLTILLMIGRRIRTGTMGSETGQPQGAPQGAPQGPAQSKPQGPGTANAGDEPAPGDQGGLEGDTLPVNTRDEPEEVLDDRFADATDPDQFAALYAQHEPEKYAVLAKHLGPDQLKAELADALSQSDIDPRRLKHSFDMTADALGSEGVEEPAPEASPEDEVLGNEPGVEPEVGPDGAPEVAPEEPGVEPEVGPDGAPEVDPQGAEAPDSPSVGFDQSTVEDYAQKIRATIDQTIKDGHFGDDEKMLAAAERAKSADSRTIANFAVENGDQDLAGEEDNLISVAFDWVAHQIANPGPEVAPEAPAPAADGLDPELADAVNGIAGAEQGLKTAAANRKKKVTGDPTVPGKLKAPGQPPVAPPAATNPVDALLDSPEYTVILKDFMSFGQLAGEDRADLLKLRKRMTAQVEQDVANGVPVEEALKDMLTQISLFRKMANKAAPAQEPVGNPEAAPAHEINSRLKGIPEFDSSMSDWIDAARQVFEPHEIEAALPRFIKEVEKAAGPKNKSIADAIELIYRATNALRKQAEVENGDKNVNGGDDEGGYNDLDPNGLGDAGDLGDDPADHMKKESVNERLRRLLGS